MDDLLGAVFKGKFIHDSIPVSLNDYLVNCACIPLPGNTSDDAEHSSLTYPDAQKFCIHSLPV